MARRRRRRHLPLFGSVSRFLWLCSQTRRRRAPAAAAVRQPQPLALSSPPAPPSPSPRPPSLRVAAAVIQPQPPSQPQALPPPPSPAPPSPSTPFASPAPSPPTCFVAPPRDTNKRKSAESFSEDDVKKGESTSVVEPVRKKVTLDEIRELPTSGTRPFYPRKLIPRYRSIKEPEPWKCPLCQQDNFPQMYLLFSLPAFKCTSCGTDPPEGDADFGFCFADLGINDACPIGHVKNQEPGECIPNTLASCIEITDRIMMTILDEPISKKGPYIDVPDLLVKYNQRWLAEGNEPMKGYNGYSLMTMLGVFQNEGVKEKSSGTEPNSKQSDKLHKISDWVLLNPKDFVGLCAALADGYPLPFGFNLGKNIAYLEPGEIYMPPPDDAKNEDGTAPERHFALLVGAQQEKRVHGAQQEKRVHSSIF